MKKHSHARRTSARSLFHFTRTVITVLCTLVLAATAVRALPFYQLGRLLYVESSYAALTVLVTTDPPPRTLPYAEDFSSLAHASSAYPVGWSGAQVGAGTSAGSGATFKTIGPTSDLGLTANGTASSTAGAVHNFNGKIGLLSTGSVDPSLVVAIDTTGRTGINIAFDVMTIRNPYNGSTNTRINEVDLQYRICTSLPCMAGFASASIAPGIYRNNTVTQTSGTAPQNPEAKVITLPAAADNQPYVQIRWVQRDISGTGGRPSFAVDNISVSGAALCTAPAITLQPEDQNATYGATAVSFTSAASGDPAPTVQWEADSGSGFVALNNGGGISGVDTPTLSISVPEVALTGYVYRAVFTNGCASMPSVTSNAATLSVSPLSITVTPDSAQTKVYGDTDPVLTYAYTPSPVFDDTFSGDLAREPGESVGNYNIIPGTLALSANYNLIVTSGVAFAITPRPVTASIIVSDKVYDGTDAAAFDCSLTSVIPPDVVSCSGNAATFPSDNVGVYSVTATGLVLAGTDSGNYSLPVTTASDGAQILVKPVTVTAVSATKVLDGNTSSNGIPTVSPSLVAGDSANFIQTYDTPFAGTGKTLTPSGNAIDGNGGSNYSYTFVPVHTGVITTGYCFDGFHGPIGGSVENGNGGTFADPVRAFKLNTTIPIKFTLYSGGCGIGIPITTGVHTLQMIKYANAVDSEPAIDATPTDAATTGNQFRLVDTEWHYNLDTKRTPGITPGTWLIKATLFDGSVKTVWISIKK